MIARRIRADALPKRSFDDEELAHVLSVWKSTGSELEARDDFDPPLSESEAQRALALALKKWPEEFEDVLANEGVSDVTLARAHREALGDPKVSAKHTDVLHKLKGRLAGETSDFERGLAAAERLALILSGQAPVPDPISAALDVTPRRLPE